MIAYMLLNDWIFIGIIVLMFVFAVLSGLFAGVSYGYNKAKHDITKKQFVDNNSFVKCNDGKYRLLGTVLEIMGTNQHCNAYNSWKKTEDEGFAGWAALANSHMLSTNDLNNLWRRNCRGF